MNSYPNRGDYNTAKNGFTAVKDLTVLSHSHQYANNIYAGDFNKDHLSYVSKGNTANNNLYLQRHEIFPGYTLHKPISLQK